MESKHESFYRQAKEAYEEGGADRAKSFLARILVEDPQHQGAALLFAECHEGDEKIKLLEKVEGIDRTSELGNRAKQLREQLQQETPDETPRQPSSSGDASSNNTIHSNGYVKISEGMMIAGRFEIKERIKSGAYGTAWVAHDVKLEQLCVIKQLHYDGDATADELRQEVKMLAKLNVPGHPSIPHIFDTLADEYCLVMQYIDGTDLRTVKYASESEALHDMRDIAGALVYMTNHKDGPVSHKDIWPANIVRAQTSIADRMRNGWRPYIWMVDFGTSGKSNGHGAPLFRAPEVDREIKNDPRSDVYSLARTFTWALDQSPSIKKTSPEFRRIVKAASEENLEKRPYPELLFTSLDQLIALRRAQQHFIGLLIVFAIAILSTLAVALPIVSRLQGRLGQAGQTITSQTVSLREIGEQLQGKSDELNKTNIDLGNANAELDRVNAELADALDKKIFINTEEPGELVGIWDADNWLFENKGDNYRSTIKILVAPGNPNTLRPYIFVLDSGAVIASWVPETQGPAPSLITFTVQNLKKDKTYIIRVTVGGESIEALAEKGKYTLVIK